MWCERKLVRFVFIRYVDVDIDIDIDYPFHYKLQIP